MTLVGARRIERLGLALVVTPLGWLLFFDGDFTHWHSYLAVSVAGGSVWLGGVLLARRLRATLSPGRVLVEEQAADADARRHPDGLTARSEASPLIVAGVGVVLVFGGLALLMWLLS
jgi:hypothetical protein